MGWCKYSWGSLESLGFCLVLLGTILGPRCHRPGRPNAYSTILEHAMHIAEIKLALWLPIVAFVHELDGVAGWLQAASPDG